MRNGITIIALGVGLLLAPVMRANPADDRRGPGGTPVGPAGTLPAPRIPGGGGVTWTSLAIDPAGKRLAAGGISARGVELLAVYDLPTRKLALLAPALPKGTGGLDLAFAGDGSLLIGRARAVVPPPRPGGLERSQLLWWPMRPKLQPPAPTVVELASLSGIRLLAATVTDDDRGVRGASVDTIGEWALASAGHSHRLSPRKVLVDRKRIPGGMRAPGAIDRGGRVLVAGDFKGRLAAWAVEEPSEPVLLDLAAPPPGAVDPRRLAIAIGGKLVAVAGDAEPGADPAMLRVFETVSGGKVADCAGHSGEVTAVAFSGDGKRLLSGSVDGTARLWDVARGGELAVLGAEGKPVRAVALADDGKLAAAGGDDGLIRLYDVAAWANAGDGVRIAAGAARGDGTKPVPPVPDAKRPLLVSGERVVTVIPGDGSGPVRRWLVRLAPDHALIREFERGDVRVVHAQTRAIAKIRCEDPAAEWEYSDLRKEFEGPTLPPPPAPGPIEVTTVPTSNTREAMLIFLGVERLLHEGLRVVLNGDDEGLLPTLKRRAEDRAKAARRRNLGPVADLYAGLPAFFDDVANEVRVQKEAVNDFNTRVLNDARQHWVNTRERNQENLVAQFQILIGLMPVETEVIEPDGDRRIEVEINDPDLAREGIETLAENAAEAAQDRLTSFNPEEVVSRELLTRGFSTLRDLYLTALTHEVVKQQAAQMKRIALERKQSTEPAERLEKSLAIQQARIDGQLAAVARVGKSRFGLDERRPIGEADLIRPRYFEDDFRKLEEHLEGIARVEEQRMGGVSPFARAEILALKILAMRLPPAQLADKLLGYSAELLELARAMPAGPDFDRDRAELLCLAGDQADLAALAEITPRNWLLAFNPRAVEAVRLYEAALRADPTDPDGRIRERLAMALAKAGRPLEAYAMAQAVESFRSHSPRFQFHMARLSAGLELEAKGMNHLREAVERLGFLDLPEALHAPEFASDDRSTQEQFKALTRFRTKAQEPPNRGRGFAGLDAGPRNGSMILLTNESMMPLEDVTLEVHYTVGTRTVRDPVTKKRRLIKDDKIFVVKLDRLDPGQPVPIEVIPPKGRILADGERFSRVLVKTARQGRAWSEVVVGAPDRRPSVPRPGPRPGGRR